jgi:PEP-CTERM motif
LVNGFTNSLAGGIFSFAEVGNNLQRNFIHAVPEPSIWALLGTGLGLAALTRWRRRRGRW